MPHDPTTARQCPFCGSDALVNGVIGGSDAYAYFKPSDLKLLGRLFASIQFRDRHPATACRQCGHVWAQVDAEELSAFWEKWHRASGA